MAPLHKYFPPSPTPPPLKNGQQLLTSAGGFTFRFAAGTTARQIFADGHSYKCKKIILVTPDSDFSVANTQSIFYGIGSGADALDHAAELPPGSSETVEINDVAKLWFVGQNTTDIIFGRVEA